MPQRLEIGNQVELTEDADFSPYAIVPKGARGRVVLKDDSIVEIKLDKCVPGLRHHNNTIWTSPHVPDNVQFRRVRALPSCAKFVAAAFVFGLLTTIMIEPRIADALNIPSTVETLEQWTGLDVAIGI